MSSYLKNVQFKKSDVSRFARGYLTNIRVVILVTALLVAGGLASFFTLPRTLNPQVDIPIVFVSTALPGAAPEDVESLVTIPLEDAVRSVSGIDVATAVSSPSSSSITLQFFSNVDAEKAKQDVQSAVDTVTDLPDDATTPRVAKLDFEDQPIWSFALVTNADDATLLRYADTLKDRIENLTKIDRVVLRGWEEQEVQVTIDPNDLNTLNISPITLSQTIRSAVNAQPAGTVATDNNTFTLSIDPSATTLDELRDVLIRANGASYRLGEIAEVAVRPVPDAYGAYYLEPGQVAPVRSVTFDIYKSLSERIDESYAETQSLVDTELTKQEGQFTIATINSMADQMNEQFTSLLKNFAITIGLVFIVLLLFFGLRQAIVASFTIPLTFMGALLVMNIAGISLSFLSLFSLLLSLGLLVDVTIVILSAITSYYRTGRFSAQDAGLITWRDYGVTLLVTTLTTVWAFFPLLLATGIIGEFIKPIPIVVSATLISSLLVGLLIVLPFMITFLKLEMPRRVRIFLAISATALVFAGFFFAFSSNPLAWLIALIALLIVVVALLSLKRLGSWVRTSLARKGKFTMLKQCALSLSHDGIFRLDGLANRYRRIISKILTSVAAKRKTTTIVVLFFLFSVTLIPAGLVKNEFFPKEDQDFFYVQLELPKGSRVENTRDQALSIAQQLKNENNIREMHIQLATSFSADGSVTSGADHTALLTARLVDENVRTKDSIELANEVRENFSDYTQAEVSVFELSGGPPAGADIQVTLLGDDRETLDSLADQFIEYLEGVTGTANIEKSITPGTPKVTVVPDAEILAREGFMTNDAALLLRTFANGFDLEQDVSFTDLEDERDIVLRLSPNTTELENIGNLVAPQNARGAPLYSFGEMKLESNPSEITRQDGKRSLSVTASVLDGYSTAEVGQQLSQFASGVSFPEGYEWKTGGVNEENQESVQSILQAMILAFLLILGTLVIRLGSYRKALIVLLVIPLALTGVFTLFGLTGTPLSFPALIGVLALFGIVVNNSIILVDKINQNLREGIEQLEAVTDASAGRLEPILLSSITTIIGLTPITLSDPLWQGLGGAIIAGLIFSGTIMLFFIPVVYVMWMKESEVRG